MTYAGVAAYVIVALGCWRSFAAQFAYEETLDKLPGDPGFDPMWGLSISLGFLYAAFWPIVLLAFAASRIPWPAWPFALANERQARKLIREREIEKAEREAGL
jgi:hypothetical protein